MSGDYHLLEGIGQLVGTFRRCSRVRIESEGYTADFTYSLPTPFSADVKPMGFAIYGFGAERVMRCQILI
jgi:hypothetical protein